MAARRRRAKRSRGSRDEVFGLSTWALIFRRLSRRVNWTKLINMIKELDCAVLVDEEPKHGVAAGDIGTVVHVYPDAVAYEVEFVTLTGRTAALVTWNLR